MWTTITETLYGASKPAEVPGALLEQLAATNKLSVEIDVAIRNLKAFHDAMKPLASTMLPVVNDMVELGGGSDASEVVFAANALKEDIRLRMLLTIGANLSCLAAWKKSLSDLAVKLNERKAAELNLCGLRARLVNARGSLRLRSYVQTQIDTAEEQRNKIVLITEKSYNELVRDKTSYGSAMLKQFAAAQSSFFEKGAALAQSTTIVSLDYEQKLVNTKVSETKRNGHKNELNPSPSKQPVAVIATQSVKKPMLVTKEPGEVVTHQSASPALGELSVNEDLVKFDNVQTLVYQYEDDVQLTDNKSSFAVPSTIAASNSDTTRAVVKAESRTEFNKPAATTMYKSIPDEVGIVTPTIPTQAFDNLNPFESI